MKKLLIIWALLISVCYAQSKAGFYVVGGKVITVQDTSSRNYLKAIENAGVVPSVLQNAASNFLVTSEKAIGSYSLMTAQYPYIGGTSATHKFNLNNPNGAFDLTYSGTITHSALGIQGDGSTGFANTNVNHLSNLSTGNQGLSVYLRTNFKSVGASAIAMDIGVTGVSSQFYIIGRYADENTYYDNTPSSIISFNSQGSSIGFFIGTTFGGNVSVFKNGLKMATTPVLAGTLNINRNIYILCRNDQGVTKDFSPRQQGYAGIHQGFSDTQAIQQSRIVTFFNTMQNR